jgi:serine/threonine-protein kinase PRP4
MSMDLRKMIKKFGSVGVSMAAVRSYAKQLCIALRHLKKCNILHADIKMDNILLNASMNVLQICDLGSAGKLDEVLELTPYLCSRFYRAPECMLGLKYDEKVDLWSVACCLYELYTGRILFAGADNNSMLKCIQDVKGRFPKRMLQRAAFAAQHFDAEGTFEYKKIDTTATGTAAGGAAIAAGAGGPAVPAPAAVRVTKIRYSDKPPKDLYGMLRDATGSRASHAEHAKLKQLADFIHQATALDPAQRPSAEQLLAHPFIVDD